MRDNRITEYNRAAEYCKDLPHIKGFQEVTLVDWDGKIASIIFLGGCNLRCPFCHSSSLVTVASKLESIPFENIEHFLAEKRSWIDGVVITGGEPTLDEEKLFNLIEKIKKLGFLVKIDTNGTRPAVLKRLIGENLIDYIAMDIKAPLAEAEYTKACGVKVDIDSILSSKDIVLNSKIDYEFRTTVVPGLIDKVGIIEISKSIVPAKRYCLQQFVPRDTIDPLFLEIKPYPAEELYKMATIASEYLPHVKVKNS